MEHVPIIRAEHHDVIPIGYIFVVPKEEDESFESFARRQRSLGYFVGGEVVKRSEYPELFNAIAKFSDDNEIRLPDLRGEFVCDPHGFYIYEPQPNNDTIEAYNRAMKVVT